MWICVDRDLIYRQWLFGAILVKCFRTGLRRHPSGKGGKLENPTKTGRSPLSPTGFSSDSSSPLPFPPLSGFSRIQSQINLKR